jgi:enediyne biosynthesis protein E4
MWRISIVLFIFILTNCNSPEKIKEDVSTEENTSSKLFSKLSPNETGIAFENTLTVSEDLDVFRYRNFYNGGGVGIGDINNDGLPDVYLVSNMGKKKLFLNKGNWKFEDISEKAGVTGTKIWSTGVSMADVNADGLLDIYVCNSGDVNGGNRENELFINNGNLTFTDRAKEYGLADKGFSTHAVFLDYDKDGDLDCYVLNNSFKPVATLGYKNLRNERDELGGDKLYRNTKGKFEDVSEAAGIYGSVIGFGLGVTVGDINQDNWPDIYISNDFYERDYLYINNHDGTFSEKLTDYMGHLSMFSMGADIADINNDGYPDIFSTDMLPEEDFRLKTLVAFETYDVYKLRQSNGYYHQFMRNMLHLNNKDGSFSEIGQLAGVEATDWSWGALIADFDNDASKEIFVCNGIYKDLINQDFVEFLGSNENMRAAIEGKAVDFKEFVDKMPSQKISNYLFVQGKDFQFKNSSAEWGLDEPGFSNGAAYGDLDNDGDLDLVVNNVNQDAFIYENQSEQLKKNNFLAVSFKGTGSNTFGLGANVRAFLDGQVLYSENMPMRGFQSSMDYKMILGLGNHQVVDSMIVLWPDNRKQVLTGVKANQHVILDQANAKEIRIATKNKAEPSLFKEVSSDEIRHTENEFNEFDRDRLLYHMVSTEGPAFVVADLNGDGKDDFFLGGSIGNPGNIYMQKPGEKFAKLASPVFKEDSLSDDVDALFFDFDNDKDLDLYVVSGGTEHSTAGLALQDRLYENKGLTSGTPQFIKTQGKLPPVYQAGSCVRPADVDKDGDLDLFVGTRVRPSYYGLPCDQYLLLNDGKGTFTDASTTFAPQLKRLGLVTDASWFDYDGNGFQDLMIVGDWMPITLFLNDGKQLKKTVNVEGLANSEGWWNSLASADIDNDGDTDFVIGNLGRNSKFSPSLENPVTLYVNDFDQNGSMEPIFAFNKEGKEYPFALRQDIVKQMSSLKKQFVYYKDYADKTIPEIYDKTLLEKSTKLFFRQPNTTLLLNKGKGGFELKVLPVEAQFSPVFGIKIEDVNHDKNPDLILGGNLFSVKPEAGRYDALHGLVLSGDGKGNFMSLNSQQSGIKLDGEVRHINAIRTGKGSLLAFVRNNDAIKFYKLNN